MSKDRVERVADFVRVTVFVHALLLPAVATPADSSRDRDVAKGKELFARYCSGCHGEDGPVEAIPSRRTSGTSP